MAQQESSTETNTDPKKSPSRRSGRGSTALRKPPALVIGDELEYRIARLYIFMGYFVRRACPIYTVSSLDQATDLDIVALRYIKPIRRELLITECKSGDNRPLDRIFWLAGVQHYVKATQAYLVRRGTKWNIKDFAKECGVQVLDLFRVAELETALKISDSDWPGISEKAFYQAERTSWNQNLVSEPRYWELYQTLTSEIRYDDPFVGVNYLLSQLRIITRSWKKPPLEAYFRFLITEAVTQLAVFLVRIVELSFDLSSNDRHGFIKKGLTYGNLEPQYADRILNSAYNMTRQAVVHYTNQFVDIDRTLFSMPAPPSTDEIIKFVDELMAAYPLNLTMAQVCDLILFEIFTKRKETRGWLKRIFPEPDLASRVELVRKFINLLVSIDACPPYVQDSINAALKPIVGQNAKMQPKSNEQSSPLTINDLSQVNQRSLTSSCDDSSAAVGKADFIETSAPRSDPEANKEDSRPLLETGQR
jgi:hypothetical protein